MSTRKGIDIICVAVLILTLLLTVAFINGERFGIQVLVDEDAEGSAASAWFTANDLKGDWSSSAATVITLKGDTAAVSGGGAYFYDGNVIISGAGRFVLRGTLDDGSIVVDAKTKSKVWLLLDGVSVSCTDDAALRVDQADKVFLTLAEGSVNSLTSGAAYSDEALADGRDGALFSHDDLTINGSGSLTVTALYRHGIAANDDLVITGGTITVSAVQDAIRANDCLHICRADVTAEAGDDALILNGAEGMLYIESGTLTLSAASDGVHSAGDILLAGGDMRICAGDDGIHSDTAISVTGGTLLIEECYEGIEALTIDISGGDLSIFPTDDGLNANGKTGGFGPGFGGEAAADTADTETWIHISGGSLTVVNETARDADGLDSNGDIVISGGVIRVSLPAGGTNSALDYGSESGGVCTVTGGEIVACGSYSMAEGFDDSSTQCAVLYNFSEGAEAGTTLSVETSDGRTLLSYTVPCSFNSVSLSSPELQLGETYRIVIGDSSEEITLTQTAASYGNAASSMFGGPMNWGSGMQRPGGGGRPGRPSEKPADQSGSDGEQMGPPLGRPDFGGAPPDGEGMGPPPDRPDFGGAPPDGEEMGPPPDRPDFDGAPPDREEMNPPSDMPDFAGERPEQSAAPDAEAAADQTAAAAETQFVPTAETWILLTLSLMALAGGLILANRFEP